MDREYTLMPGEQCTSFTAYKLNTSFSVCLLQLTLSKESYCEMNFKTFSPKQGKLAVGGNVFDLQKQAQDV